MVAVSGFDFVLLDPSTGRRMWSSCGGTWCWPRARRPRARPGRRERPRCPAGARRRRRGRRRAARGHRRRPGAGRSGALPAPRRARLRHLRPGRPVRAVDPEAHRRAAERTLVLGMIESPTGVAERPRSSGLRGWTGSWSAPPTCRSSSGPADPTRPTPSPRCNRTLAEAGAYRMDIVNARPRGRRRRSPTAPGSWSTTSPPR